MAWIRSPNRVSHTGHIIAFVIDAESRIAVVSSDGTSGPLTNVLEAGHAGRALDALAADLEQNLTVIDLTQIVSATQDP